MVKEMLRVITDACRDAALPSISPTDADLLCEKEPVGYFL
jgi:hypothetical protein